MAPSDPLSVEHEVPSTLPVYELLHVLAKLWHVACLFYLKVRQAAGSRIALSAKPRVSCTMIRKKGNAPGLRVVSLLPSATDTVHALQLDHLLVGVSHQVRQQQPTSLMPYTISMSVMLAY